MVQLIVVVQQAVDLAERRPRVRVAMVALKRRKLDPAEMPPVLRGSPRTRHYEGLRAGRKPPHLATTADAIRKRTIRRPWVSRGKYARKPAYP